MLNLLLSVEFVKECSGGSSATPSDPVTNASVPVLYPQSFLLESLMPRPAAPIDAQGTMRRATRMYSKIRNKMQ